jgi:hypothetical protein
VEKRPVSYFGFFKYLKETVNPNVEIVNEIRSKIDHRTQTDKAKKDAVGVELMDEAMDALQPQKIRAILYVLENDLGMPLYQIVQVLKDKSSK